MARWYGQARELGVTRSGMERSALLLPKLGSVSLGILLSRAIGWWFLKKHQPKFRHSVSIQTWSVAFEQADV
jgi:hypothetical protein